MVLPTGTISMSQVNTELGISPSATTISLNQANVRALASVPSGTISMSDLQGKSASVTISYYPTASPTSVTNTPSATGFNLTAAGTYVMTVNGPLNAPFIMWGAGGRSNASGPSSGGAGGGAVGTLALSPGTNYYIVVGSTGTAITANSVCPSGGGGAGGTHPSAPNVRGGAGGGYSGVFVTSVTQANARIMAGGGGGGHGTDTGAFVATGGGGGGTNGQTGFPEGGGGATPTAGGAGDVGPGTNGTAGSALQGGVGGPRGVNQGGGGGGGGGYFGGGGGAAGGFGPSAQSGSPGGGGSGRIHPAVTGGTLYAASGTTAGNSSSPHRGTSGNQNVNGRVKLLPV